ncbi:hypothetical protein [Lacisediminihabitans sp. H27-G8]|uniref:hypothetical protein n=1 Tax=Lacisediminihabitans sp. H27-G8 TaxID=3111909 RepID=UPI0038FC193D
MIDDVVSGAESPGAIGDIVDQLAELRRRLLSEDNSWLTALVSLRPELEITIGCLMQVQQFPLDDDDSPDTFEVMLKDGTASPARGTRTRVAETWRTEAMIGEVVGLFHRFDLRELGDEEGRLEQRTIFGVFPPKSSDMVRFIFTVSDLAAFDDMPKDTQAIVETLRVTLEESAS